MAVREVHVQLVRVDAPDERSAIDAVRDGMGEEIDDPWNTATPYYTTWTVEGDDELDLPARTRCAHASTASFIHFR